LDRSLFATCRDLSATKKENENNRCKQQTCYEKDHCDSLFFGIGACHNKKGLHARFAVPVGAKKTGSAARKGLRRQTGTDA
jgi:hypothetical protein